MSGLQGKAGGDDGGGDPANRSDPWIGSVTNVSAFLAGFSLAAVVVIANAPDSFRWPGAAALALTIASVVLVLAAQESRLGARYSSPYSETWREVIWVAYHVGLMALFAGLGAALAPKGGAGQQGLRWAAAYVAWFAVAVELGLVARTLVKRDIGTSAGRG